MAPKALTSKLTSKSQTVIPREIRRKLGVLPGDRLRYVETPQGILIEKAPPSFEEDPFATFTEWATDADDEAYADL